VALHRLKPSSSCKTIVSFGTEQSTTHQGRSYRNAVPRVTLECGFAEIRRHLVAHVRVASLRQKSFANLGSTRGVIHRILAMISAHSVSCKRRFDFVAGVALLGNNLSILDLFGRCHRGYDRVCNLFTCTESPKLHFTRTKRGDDPYHLVLCVLSPVPLLSHAS